MDVYQIPTALRLKYVHVYIGRCSLNKNPINSLRNLFLFQIFKMASIKYSGYVQPISLLLLVCPLEPKRNERLTSPLHRDS